MIKRNNNKFGSEFRDGFESGFRPIDLSYFEPLQVKVRGPSKEEFDESSRIFKSVVQKDKVLSLYKEKQQYEKPSIKKRRKQREAHERRLSAELKEELIKTGEWDKRMKKKLAKKHNNTGQSENE